MTTQDNRNFDNRTLFWGDNIDFMRAMNSETVDLIATDPPFNKGRDFHATPDSLAAGASFQDRWKWDEEAHPQFTDALRDDPKNKNIWTVIESARASWGDDMGAFLCFMGVRLMEMRRVLKQTGSIYLHCDPTASHYLKTLMDAVFGRGQFISEIIWNYGTPSGGRVAGKKPVKTHENLLVYARAYGKHTYNIQYLPYSEKYISERFTHVDEDGRRYQTRKRSGSVTRQYLDESSGVPLSNVWADLKALYARHLVKRKEEETGYPTQKPLDLYERIIRVSSNEGEVVLDPFAGCATTAVAAERLNRQWVAVDLWEETRNLTVSRLEAEQRIFAVEQMTVTQTPPERTDDGEVASPDLRLEMQEQPAKWQRLFRHEMFDYLAEAQGTATGLVMCAGCGREMESEYMELDHILPKKDGGENYITNRILLCRPCNGWKSDRYTLSGLQRENKRRKDRRGNVWMQDEAGAQGAQLRARRKADEVRRALG